MQAIELSTLATVHGGYYDVSKQLAASFKRISDLQVESSRRNAEYGVLAATPIGNLAVGIANKLAPNH